jgi:hypothetical protein
MRTHRLSNGTRKRLLALLEELCSGVLDPYQFSQRWPRFNLKAAEGLPHLKGLIETYFELLAQPAAAPMAHLDVRWSDNIRTPQEALSLLTVYLGELLPRQPRINLPLPAASAPADADTLPRPASKPSDRGR